MNKMNKNVGVVDDDALSDEEIFMKPAVKKQDVQDVDVPSRASPTPVSESKTGSAADSEPVKVYVGRGAVGRGGARKKDASSCIELKLNVGPQDFTPGKGMVPQQQHFAHFAPLQMGQMAPEQYQQFQYQQQQAMYVGGYDPALFHHMMQQQQQQQAYHQPMGSLPLSYKPKEEKCARPILRPQKAPSGMQSFLEEGRIEELDAILERNKASIDKKNKNGKTALMLCCRDGLSAHVDLLMKYNAALDLQDKYGWTALMHAAYNGRRDIVRTLLRNGASADLKGAGGKDALALAHEHEAKLKDTAREAADTDTAGPAAGPAAGPKGSGSKGLCRHGS